jgi:membrane-associated phospholipid phosphatase
MIPTPIRARLLGWVLAHRWQLLMLFIGVLIPLWVFGELADEVLEREDLFFDRPILLFLHSYATPLFDQFMLLCSLLGYQYGVIPIDLAVAALLIVRRRWGDMLFWSFAVGGAALLNLAAKHSFGRARPDLWISIAPEPTLSFPSGHAMGSMACVAAAIVLLWPTRWRVPLLMAGVPFVFLVGLSRVYLGVHYPSDILAGWTASLAWVAGISLTMYGHLTKPTEQAQPSQ